MKTTSGIVLAAVASMALGACNKATITNTTPPPPTLGSPTYVVSAPCPATIPKIDPNPYEIMLSNAFDLRKATVGKGSHPSGTHAGNHSKTALDWMTLVDANQSGTIKIILQDTQLHFQAGDQALLGATTDAPNELCGLTKDQSNGSDPRWLSFTVHAGATYSAGYDLGLLVDQSGPSGQPQLPVIIDPWVDNNGVIEVKK